MLKVWGDLDWETFNSAVVAIGAGTSCIKHQALSCLDKIPILFARRAAFQCFSIGDHLMLDLRDILEHVLYISITMEFDDLVP